MANTVGSVWMSQITLNSDRFSQIFRVMVKWVPPVYTMESIQITIKYVQSDAITVQ